MFSSSSFKVSCLILRSLIHCKLIFVQNKRKGSDFNLLLLDIQFSQDHLLKRLSFIQRMFLAPLSRIRWLELHWLISRFLFYSIGLRVVLFQCYVGFITMVL
jgi:hypothetical protein